MPKGDTARANEADVILLRGWRDMYSDGINQLAGKLQAEGYRAAVFGESQWKDVADVLASRRGVVALVGFSYGADHAVDVARRLDANGVVVPLLITLDPVTPPRVPLGVGMTYNYYQSTFFWDIFPWFRGVPLKSETGHPNLINIDVHDRPDLDDPTMAHSTIAASELIHRQVIHHIKTHLPRARM